MRTTQAGNLVNFTKKEYTAAVNGLAALIERLDKTAKSLNPQDPARETIESKVGDLKRFMGQLQASYKELNSVNV